MTQSAYEIEVASSAANLAADKADLWDSGRVTGAQQNQIVYEGKALASREQAFWKVRIWDQSGAPSAWSAPATWTMGLLERGDWSAQWIGDSTASTTNVAATALRRRFTLAARPSRAIVYASALGVYELQINGQRVGDHVLAPEFTDYRIRTQYQAYDVTPLLKRGENVIAAWLGDGWYAGGIGLAEDLVKQRRNIYGDHPRLLAQLEVSWGGEHHADRDRFVVARDAGWADPVVGSVERRGVRRASSDAGVGRAWVSSTPRGAERTWRPTWRRSWWRSRTSPCA